MWLLKKLNYYMFRLLDRFGDLSSKLDGDLTMKQTKWYTTTYND